MAGWDTNWVESQGIGKLPLNAFNQLRAALAERAAVMNSAPTLPANLSAGELPSASWFTTFQSAVTAMLPASPSGSLYGWVNHNDSATRVGYWDGAAWGANAGPSLSFWSQSTMLTQIGAASRVAAPGAGDIWQSAAWAYQQYQILNQLRWYGRLAPESLSTNVFYKYGSSAIDYPTAAAIHDAMAWAAVSTAPVPNNTRNNCWQAQAVGGSFWKQSIKWVWSWSTWGVSSAEFDVYVRPNQLTGGPVYNMHTANVANYVKNITVAPSTGFEYGGTHALTPTLNNTIWFRATSNWYGLYLVVKFDVSGGFDYYDPDPPATTTT